MPYIFSGSYPGFQKWLLALVVAPFAPYSTTLSLQREGGLFAHTAAVQKRALSIIGPRVWKDSPEHAPICFMAV